MGDGTDDFSAIVARAASPGERLEYSGFSPVGPRPDGQNPRVDRWKAGVAAGDDALTQALLDIRGYDEADLANSLADVQVTDPNDLPEWVEVLSDLLADMESFAETGWRPDLPTIGQGISLVFDALLPFVYSGAIFLEKSIEPLDIEVEPNAREQILRTLEGRLLSTAMHVLDDEVRAGEAAARLVGATHERATVAGSPTAWKQRFLRYPVLGRLMALSYRNWTQLMSELLVRLDHDRQTLEAELFHGAELGKMVSFGGDAGDLHEQGRSVALLGFDTGNRVAYKPKDLRVSERFQALLEDLNIQGIEPALPVRRVIARGPYAWEEFIDDAPCLTEDEVEHFYTRLGMFARLLQLLGGRDFWFDNLIAAGPMPAFIDLETAIQQRPRIPASRLSEAEDLAYEYLEESAVNIGLIAQCTPVAEGVPAEDIGAMTPTRRFTTPFRFEYSDSINDLLDPVLSADGYVQWTKTDYAPTLRGESVDPAMYIDQVARGYGVMHEHLAAHRRELGASDGALATLGSVPARHIQRDTWSCMKIINNSLRSAVLVDGVRREAYLEGLLRSAPRSGALDITSLTSLQSEVDAFRDLDVPLFQTLPESSAVMLRGGRELADFFPGTAMQRVWDRLERIEEVDVDNQISLLRSNLSTGAHQPRRFERSTTRSPHADHDWLSHAVAIGDDLILRAFVGEGRTSSWLGVTYHPAHALQSVEALRPDLLSGVCGMAILFSDLHEATGSARFADAAYGALDSTRRIVAESTELFAALRLDPARNDTLYCGRWYGIGAQIHTLRRAAKSLGDPGLDVLATEYVDRLDLGELVARSPIDLVGGLAGLLTILLPENVAAGPSSASAGRIAAELLDRLDRQQGVGPAPYPCAPGPLRSLPALEDGVMLALDRAIPFLTGALQSRAEQWRQRLTSAESPASCQHLIARLSRHDAPSDGTLAADVAKFLGADVATQTSVELLDSIELSLASSRVFGTDVHSAGANAAACELVDRQGATGGWFPESYAADRHRLSIIDGVPALAQAFLRLDGSFAVESIRRV